MIISSILQRRARESNLARCARLRLGVARLLYGSTYSPWCRVVLPARAPRRMSGVAGVRRPRALLGVRTLEKSVQLHGAGIRTRGVGFQASLVLLDLRFAAVLDGVDRGTARARRASSTRQAGCRQAAAAHCFAAQALSDCLSSLHVACQLPGLESTQSTYALSSVGQCRSTVANAASISSETLASPRALRPEARGG